MLTLALIDKAVIRARQTCVTPLATTAVRSIGTSGGTDPCVKIEVPTVFTSQVDIGPIYIIPTVDVLASAKFGPHARNIFE
ncbi:hypothetical protein HOLleu_05782 [Holothuria leucospilota]|uniref:Uncharacterized protein n=1 Tax=Holothuria leucospilota TaxID=206669 RepID=A0A9Q1HJ58_HOLLE|nr:hypothetical protein HOLleu_05782 [Holothuria leucospilota]